MITGPDKSIFNPIAEIAPEHSFAFFRASDGKTPDASFIRHLDHAECVVKGAYHRLAEGVAIDDQLETCLDQLRLAKEAGHYIRMFGIDCERRDGKCYDDPVRMVHCVLIIAANVDVKSQWLYANRSQIESFKARAHGCMPFVIERLRLWLADPTLYVFAPEREPRIPDNTWKTSDPIIWQTGAINGVDHNIFTGTREQFASIVEGE